MVTKEAVNRYSSSDVVLDILEREANEVENQLLCQKWLFDSLPQRYIFTKLYCDLLNQEGLKILDVGGGLTTFMRLLSEKHELHELELFVHDSPESIKYFEDLSDSNIKILHTDWHDYTSEQDYDIMIVNGLFPNADQRLNLFLNKYLLCGSEFRGAFHFYNNERFYQTKRIDAEEVLTVMAWDGEATYKTLQRHDLISEDSKDEFLTNVGSLYDNGRQVVCLRRKIRK